MNFIGKQSEYNIKLKELITVTGYTIVSYIDDLTIKVENTGSMIQIFPIDDSNGYFSSIQKGMEKTLDNYVYKTNSCTNIFVYMHEYVDPKVIADIVNTFDKENLVDCIHVYPKVGLLKVRDNELENLPWQKKINGILS
jgi:hypothetical protein